MASVEKITISLPDTMLAEIKAAVDAGEFANTSEAIRDALRHWRRSRMVLALNDEQLRRMVEAGRKSGRPVDGEAAFNRLRSKYAAMAGKRGR